MTNLPQAVIDAIREALPHATTPLPLHEPTFGTREFETVQECVDSTFESTVGKFVEEFEKQLAAYTGARHAVAVINGTAALHIALLLCGIKPGDEVILPALTFIAPANAVRYCQATPHFVDCNEQTLGIDPSALRKHLSAIAQPSNGQCLNRHTGAPIRAIMPVHILGHPCQIDELLEISGQYDLIFIEDAAESLGSCYRGRHTGTFGQAGALSFNGNKIITTGGGGALLTNDPEIAQRAKHLTTTAKESHPWDYNHDCVGYNYRLPNLNAALGCAQLQALPNRLASKRKLFQAYKNSFAQVPGVSLVNEPANSSSNYWLQAIMLDATTESFRDEVLKATQDQQIFTRPAWKPMHQIQPHQNAPRAALPVTESISRRLICLPSSPHLA